MREARPAEGQRSADANDHPSAEPAHCSPRLMFPGAATSSRRLQTQRSCAVPAASAAQQRSVTRGGRRRHRSDKPDIRCRIRNQRDLLPPSLRRRLSVAMTPSRSGERGRAARTPTRLVQTARGRPSDPNFVIHVGVKPVPNRVGQVRQIVLRFVQLLPLLHAEVLVAHRA